MPKRGEIRIWDPFIHWEDTHYYLYSSTDPDIWRSEGVGFDVYRKRESTARRC